MGMTSSLQVLPGGDFCESHILGFPGGDFGDGNGSDFASNSGGPLWVLLRGISEMSLEVDLGECLGWNFVF